MFDRGSGDVSEQHVSEDSKRYLLRIGVEDDRCTQQAVLPHVQTVLQAFAGPWSKKIACAGRLSRPKCAD